MGTYKDGDAADAEDLEGGIDACGLRLGDEHAHLSLRLEVGLAGGEGLAALHGLGAEQRAGVRREGAQREG